MKLRFLVFFALLGLAISSLSGCTSDSLGGLHAQEDSHSEDPNETTQETRSRPTNQVAVLTVWAETEKLEATAEFYEDVLGLRPVGASAGQYIFDTDGTFIVIMEGRLDQPADSNRRWPMFALTVPDLGDSVEALQDADVELPWGIEEFGAPESSSRYVMFYDPAGNLVEIVEWL